MLREFVKPSTIVCILCKGWVSVKKGDKSRFFHHISHDHEVHHDMDLLFSLSHLQEKHKDIIVDSVHAILKSDMNEDVASCDAIIGESNYDNNDDMNLDELLKDVDEDEEDDEGEEIKEKVTEASPNKRY